MKAAVNRRANGSAPVDVTPRARAKTTAERRRRRNIAGVVAIVVIQTLCTFFFISDLLSSMIGFPSQPISWRYREFIEIGAAVGMLLGLGLGTILLSQALRRTQAMEQQLRAASGAFMDLLAERFETWLLTPAEKDVALFSIKGFSTHEIAQMRDTSEGTVKAQTNAIYRKANVAGRAQLLSLFIDDLIAEDASGKPVVRQPLDKMEQL